MAELDKTISVIESWLKQPVLTPPPINELYDALELLKEYDTQTQYRDDHIAEYEKEIKRLNKLLKEQEAVKPTWNRGKPHCGACGLRIRGGEFCSECGKPIAWEGR